MKLKEFTLPCVVLLLSLLHFSSCTSRYSPSEMDGEDWLRPFRVLVVTGDQWDDPASYVVGKINTGTTEILHPGARKESDFYHIIILLKSWGIPFDIIRLDQQLLDRYMFLDMNGKPEYGTIIWNVNQTDNLMPQDYSILPEMTEQYGIGLIVLSDHIFREEILNTLGLKYTGIREGDTLLKVKGTHFITEGLLSPFRADTGTLVSMMIQRVRLSETDMERQHVAVSDDVITIVEQGSFPQVTVREYPSGGRAVWIGNDNNYIFYFQDMRTLLRRAITWTIGYNLYKTWDNDLIMIMDDPGMADNAWLDTWHFPTLSEDTIIQYLINPLLQHNAVLNINFTPGFVNDAKERLEPTWTRVFTDEFGTKQNYVSSKRGYQKGVDLGVFTVMSHGLTHMQPDLASEPRWYGSPLSGEKAVNGWYQEFRDNRRNQEIPAAEQFWRMKTGMKWLKEQFGVTPLEVVAGGNGVSTTYFNNTIKLAGQAGFGWYGWSGGYLGSDLAVVDWKFFGTPDAPLIVGSPPNNHDYGIALEPEKFASIFDQYPDGRFISINEYIGYMHACNSGNLDRGKKRLDITLDYDPHYCQFFEKHNSVWNLEFSDWLLEESGTVSSVTVDGKKAGKFTGKVEIPRGCGSHRIDIHFRTK